MKKRHYELGSRKCTAYLKTAGYGYEVGFSCGKETIFVGNFLHAREANKWWAAMNKEMKAFARRYRVGAPASWSWYCKAFSHHLYKAYYSFLDHEFSRYQSAYAKACKQDVKKYKAYKGKWGHDHEAWSFRHAA